MTVDDSAPADGILTEAERIADFLLEVPRQVNDRIDATQAELLPGVRRAPTVLTFWPVALRRVAPPVVLGSAVAEPVRPAARQTCSVWGRTGCNRLDLADRQPLRVARSAKPCTLPRCALGPSRRVRWEPSLFTRTLPNRLTTKSGTE